MNTMPAFNDLVIFSMMAAIGIVGNVVTCFVIVRNKEMHTSINCYLFSLAITDLVILFVLFPCSLRFLQSSSTDLGCQLGYVLLLLFKYNFVKKKNSSLTVHHCQSPVVYSFTGRYL